MNSRIQHFTNDQLDRIHEATLKIWSEIGVAFKDEEALEIFKKNGVKVDGQVVFLDKKTFERAMASAPSEFVLHARNPEKNVTIGGPHIALTPGYGCPFIITADGEKKPPQLKDYENLCKLVHTSPYVNLTGNLMVEPSDVPARFSHLHMLLSNILLCDKPFVGSAVSRQAAVDTCRMASIAWGGENLEDKPVTVSIISSLSPLQYSSEMAGALIEYAKQGQANMVGGLMMAGSTGPVRLPGLITLQNAEFLAGIVLAQLIRPGVPVIYGGTSSITDMRRGALSVGAPELSIVQNAQAQMAQYYGIPCRGSGGISDSLAPDAQASLESAIALNTTLRSGSNFILHAVGILGAYIGMSYEKFLIDEEICGMLLRLYQSMEISDETIDVETIKQVGIAGEYLTHPTTFKHCRTEFFQPSLAKRMDHGAWTAGGRKWIHEIAADRLAERLGRYQRPEIDAGIETELCSYVEAQKSIAA